MSDLPFVPARPELSERLIDALDADGKIPRALAALGSLEGAEAVLLGEAPSRAAALSAAGARVSVVATPALPFPLADPAVAELLAGLAPASCDVLLGLWSTFAGPSPASLAAADRVLRPAGRLLVLQDYGRDDLDRLRGAERTAQLVGWSRRDGWYLRSGFRIHVVHAFWRAADVAEAGELLEAAFGPAGHAAAAALRRARIAHNVAVFHRPRPPA